MNRETILEIRKFTIPEFIFGTGSRFLAGNYARNLSAHKVLIVTDPGVIQHGWVDDVTGSLENEGIPYSVFSDITSNPRAEEVMNGAEIFIREKCNTLIAVGGGSPMDCAKGIGIVSSNNDHILNFEGIDEISIPGPPLICIPTTAGSSADVSQFAIITDPGKKIKIAIISKSLIPDLSLLDPEITTTLDPLLTSTIGFDALVHAVEAYVSNAHSPFTDLYALEAIRLITENIIQASKNPKIMEFRGNMMLGSLYAGLAFSNASLGAVHALAHSLGGFSDLAHGEANTILLPYVIDFQYESATERYLKIGEAMGLKNPVKKDVIDRINCLQEHLNIRFRLKDIGLEKAEIPGLAKTAIQDICMVTNPVDISIRDVETIYENAF